MKICFFSDIHGNILAFKAFLQQTRMQKIDKWIFGGDVLGYYYHADEILDCLRKENIQCLLGNHDKMFLEVVNGIKKEKELVEKYGDSYKNIVSKIKKENVAFLKTLSSAYVKTIDNCKMGFFHGGPGNPVNQRIYPDTVLEELKELQEYDFVFVGHTHHKMMRNVGRCTVVNPGSLGQQRDGRGCSYIIFDTESRQVEYYTVEYNRELLVEEINRNESQEKMCERLKEVLFRAR